MSADINSLPFPGKVFRGPGVLKYLGDFCKTRGEKVFILGGKTALTKTEGKIYTNLAQAGIQVVATEWYGGECTQQNIDRLAAAVVASQAQVIIAIGGGKALDTGKSVADNCQLPLVTIPTIAATCAAVTPLTVLYNNKGEFIGNLFLDNCPAATVIDTEIILDAPVEWLIAGMGDTLAKLYELRAAASGMTATSLTISAVMNGEICYEIIRRFGSDARQAVENQEISDAFNATVDAIILSAGLSSIFGGENLRNAAAHAIYNGFTQIPSTHAVAHGSIVGYGNLCLLALEGRPDEEIMQEIRLAASCGIPISLGQIANLSEEELKVAAKASAKATAMACMPFPVTPEMVIAAIRRVNELAGQ